MTPRSPVIPVVLTMTLRVPTPRPRCIVPHVVRVASASATSIGELASQCNSTDVSPPPTTAEHYTLIILHAGVVNGNKTALHMPQTRQCLGYNYPRRCSRWTGYIITHSNNTVKNRVPECQGCERAFLIIALWIIATFIYGFHKSLKLENLPSHGCNKQIPFLALRATKLLASGSMPPKQAVNSLVQQPVPPPYMLHFIWNTDTLSYDNSRHSGKLDPRVHFFSQVEIYSAKVSNYTLRKGGYIS
jgi:hypothetical protein